MTDDAVAGVTTITAVAARRLIAAVAAAELDVPARRVRIHLADERARWAVDIAAPVGRLGDRSVVTAAGEVRERVLRDIPRLAGAVVGRVTVRVTSIHDERTRAA